LNKAGFSPGRIFYGWWIVAACIPLSLFVTSIIAISFTAFVEPLSKELNWSYTQISVAASLRVMELGLLSPLVGWMIDHWGIRKVVISGCVILCFGLFLFSQISTLPLFYMAFFLIGIGTTCGGQASVQTVISKWFHRRFGLAIGIATAGFGLAGLFLPVVTAIIELYGWRLAALALSLIILAIATPVVLLLRDRPEQYGLLPDGDSVAERTSQSAAADKSATDDSNFSLKQALHTSTFWMLSAIFAVLYFIVQAVLTHIMPFLSSINVDRQLSSLIAAAIPIVSNFGRIGFGLLSDKFSKKTISLLAFVFICSSMFLFSFADHFEIYLIIIATLLYGIGYGGAITLSGALIRHHFGKRNFGSIFGALTGFSFIGNMLGAPTAGWIYDNWYSYDMFWMISAILAIAAIFLIQMTRSKSGSTT